MIKEFIKEKYILIYILVALIALCSFGKSVGLNYTAAPYLVLCAILVILISKISSLPNILKSLLWFIIITCISSVNYFYFKEPSTPYIQYLCYSISMFLVSIAFYGFLIRFPDSEKVIYYLFLCFFLLGVYRFFRSEEIRAVIGAEQQQNNAFYYVLMPLPILLLTKNSYLKVASLIITILICFLSLKRSAIIVISMISFVYVFFNIAKSKKKIRTILLLLSGIAFTLSQINSDLLIERYEKLIKRLGKMEEDGGSGRLGILERFFDSDIRELNKFPDFLVGKGFGATQEKYKILEALHNDWAETYYTLGIIGLLLLVYFFLQLFFRTQKAIKTDSPMRTAYVATFILFAFYSISGGTFHFINSSLTLFAFIGISEAMIKNNKTSI